MTKRKTRKMLAVEDQIGVPLETYLPERLSGVPVYGGEYGEVSDDLGISKSCLSYWLMKLGIRLVEVAVCPGDQVFAIAPDGTKRLALEV